MLRFRWVLAAGLLMATWANASSTDGLPLLDDAALSPDGSRLLMLRSNGEAYDLVVREVPGGDDRVILAAGDPPRRLNWCRWASDVRIVCSWRFSYPIARVGQVTATRLLAIDHDGTNLVELDARVRNLVGRAPQYEPQIQDRVVSWLPDDPRHILVQLNRLNPNRPSVYRLDIYNNRLSRERKHRSQIRHWYADGAGVVRIGVGFRAGDRPVVFRIEETTPRAYHNPAFDSEVPPVPLGFNAAGSEVYMSMTHGTDRHGIYRVRYSDGEVLGTVHDDPDFDVFGTLVQDPDSGEPVGVRYTRHHPHAVWFEPEVERLFRTLEARVPGQHKRLVSVDEDYRQFLFHAYGGISPAWYLVDRSREQVTLIARDYPALADAEVNDVRPVEYDSRDGKTIPAYLAVPGSAFKAPWPAVILPHGGPYDRESARFDPWVQFLTSRGIAVLKPNYRGSVGYGELFMRAGYREWGKRMQEDLVDGVDWLVGQGIADPRRICVVGASYGGYAALVAAYRHVDRFACAVSLAGISNLETMVRRIYDFDLVRRNRDRVQSGRDLRANSPFHHAREFGLPLLVIHGDEDTVVDIDQSRELVTALRSAGRAVEYLEQPGGDHFLSGGQQRQEFFGALGQFLDRTLQAGGGVDLHRDQAAVTAIDPDAGRVAAESTDRDRTAPCHAATRTQARCNANTMEQGQSYRAACRAKRLTGCAGPIGHGAW